VWTASAATASAESERESGSDHELASQREVPAWQPQAVALPEQSRQAWAEESESGPASEPELELVRGSASASDAAWAPASHAASPSRGSELHASPARRAERPAEPWAGERLRARHAPSRTHRSGLRCASEPWGDALRPRQPSVPCRGRACTQGLEAPRPRLLRRCRVRKCRTRGCQTVPASQDRSP
jgi:hypothetical protein